MKRILAAAGALAVMIATTHSLADEAPGLAFKGTATAPDSNRVIYQEFHEVSGTCTDGWWQPDRQDVRYVRPEDDKAFATKALTYPNSLQTPDVDFRQPSFGERLNIVRKGDTLAIDWSIEGEEGGSWTLNPGPDLVIDAGFDHFIRANWTTLTTGDSVTFRFLAPTRGEAYDFVVEPAPEAINGAHHSFRIRPEGLIMRLAVDPIRLGYGDDGLLTHYQGLGNIRRNQDENYRVSIQYQATTRPGCALLPRS
ncbi:hypothetical protein ACJO2E_07565 [Marinobacter sp. M1N3S26]|uniref:hypothetical protein n=1 Tax=Marinobacter sp. M1N3S26 TaxID=3382299 RepID=UPI00387B959F